MQSHYLGQRVPQRKTATARLSAIATACLIFSNQTLAEQVIADGVSMTIDDGSARDSGPATGPEGYAVWAKNGGTIRFLDTNGPNSITTHGNGADAIVAETGSTIEIHGGTVTAQNGKGLNASAVDSRITTHDVDIVSGPRRIGASAVRGASIQINGGSVTADGGNGLMAFDGRAGIIANDVTISVTGDHSSGAEANTSGTVRLQGGAVNTTGKYGHGLFAIGDAGDTSIVASGTRIRTAGEMAHGAFALSGDLTLTDVAIETSGYFGTGIWADGINDRGSHAATGKVTRGTVLTRGAYGIGAGALSGGVVNAQDLIIDTRGANAMGALAMYGGRMALTGGSITTTGDGSLGLYAFGAKAGTTQFALLSADGVSVTTQGDEAHGAVVRGASRLDLTATDITTYGAGAAALFSTDFDAGASTAVLTDSRLATARGAGIRAEGTTFDVSLVRGEVTGASDAIQAVPKADGKPATLNLLMEDSTLTGSARTDAGSTSNVSLDNRSVWNITGNSVVSALRNAGTVNLATAAGPGKTLRVTRDYVGNGGTLVLSTHMGDDASATDRLVLDGARASGNTGLLIRHAGGDGAQTTHGIRLVEAINGGGTDAGAFQLNPQSDGYRRDVGSIVAGAYDYRLSRGGNGGGADDWYLVSTRVPDDKPDDEPVLPPTPQPQPPISPFRPEVGAYLGNKLAASSMLFHTLRDRQGEAAGQQVAAQTPSDRHAWARVAGTAIAREEAGSLDGSDTRYLVHAGSDVFRWSVGQGSIRVGAMGAYGESRNRSDNGYLTARGRVEGFSGGVYGTWYGNGNTETGPYADTWLMYGAYDNEVSGQGLPTERYRSRNLVASLEGGHAFQIHDSPNARMYLVPQLQVIYANYRADSHVEQGGTVVGRLSEDSITTRVGVRLHGDVDHPETAASAVGMMRMRPFAEVNWWHGPASQTAQFDSLVVRDELPANRLEAKVGLQGNLTRRLTVWGSLGVEAGARDYTAGKAQLGLRYGW
ncbi:autotransporter family protein [Cupriavidus campinensis]